MELQSVCLSPVTTQITETTGAILTKLSGITVTHNFDYMGSQY